MLRLLHCSDLHLSARDSDSNEREYSLDVLREIVTHAEREEAAAILIAGDLFNTFSDAEALRAPVRDILAQYSGEVFYVPGNHEELERGRKSLARLDLAPLQVLQELPASLLRREYNGLTLEIVSIPHQKEYGDAPSLGLPAKDADLRIVMAHGIVADLAYSGPAGAEENEAGILDPRLFVGLEADYAALGHIHARRLESRNGVTFCYPGSPRVWRRGESGERTVALLDVNAGGSFHVRFVPIQTAGTYRRVELPLSLQGEAPELYDADLWQPQDYVDLRLSGLVEDENTVVNLEGELRRQHGQRVRRFEVRRDDVEVLEGVSGEPVARKFLELWKQREPVVAPGKTDDERESYNVYLRARELALHEIKRALEGRIR